jgi:hypothetical protein
MKKAKNDQRKADQKRTTEAKAKRFVKDVRESKVRGFFVSIQSRNEVVERFFSLVRYL